VSRLRWKNHHIPRSDASSAGGWRCECGTTGTGDPAVHLRRAAAGILRRLDQHEYAAALRLTGVDLDRGEDAAARLIYNYPYWIRERLDLLKRFTEPSFDHFGTLQLRIRWGQVVAALDAGKILAEPEHLTFLRLAASLAGAGGVNLLDVDRAADYELRKLVMEAIDKLLAPENY
jgi:hypothetical protein